MNVLNQKVDQRYALYQGDCVEVVRGLPDNSIHYSIFSPPFASLYTYSSSDRDMGNSRDNNEFQQHFNYLIEELYRITMPGRLVSVHCMNLPAMKSRDGYIGVKDFRGDIIRQFIESGFIFHSEVCIWKNPVTEMQRTKALGLLHKQIRKDSAMCRQGLPDYLVTFRKPGDNPEPIPHTHESFPVNVWQRYASPVWMDIRQSNTLQRKSARAEKDEKHICPLQLDVIERGIDLWTNPDDIVLDPFAGIGSVPYQAVSMGRRAVGIELKDSYFDLMENNMIEIENEYKEKGADTTVLLRCTKCGIKLPDGLSTCPICGSEVNT
ncbi:MAG: site-specific DNA-methyltransferase [Eubacterium sp.]|nr:site-specific DNA-methyltransferase [Eubacterium sp.]